MTRVLAIARDEILKLPSTRRGLLSVLAFGLLWLAVIVYGIIPAASFVIDGQSSGLAEIILAPLGLGALGRWPAPQLAIYWVLCLYLFPFFTLLSAADQTASDRTRGTLRFLALRCSRLEIFIGRFLGQYVIQILLVLLTLASVLVLIAIYTPELLADSVARSPVIIVNICLLLLPYVALMAWVSALAKSARQATLFAVIVWVVVSLVVGYLQSRFGPMTVLDWALPGSQISQLLRLHDWQTLNYALIPVVHAIVLLLIGGYSLHRRDL